MADGEIELFVAAGRNTGKAGELVVTVDAASAPTSSSDRIVIAMRRFRARPSAVALSATGRNSPYPTAPRRRESTPFSDRNRTAAVARAVESSQLLGKRFRAAALMGTLSVWPITWTLRL